MDTKEENTGDVAPAEKTAVLVTSTMTLDFPTLGWGIHAGESRELPEDPEAQSVILARDCISKVK